MVQIGFSPQIVNVGDPILPITEWVDRHYIGFRGFLWFKGFIEFIALDLEYKLFDDVANKLFPSHFRKCYLILIVITDVLSYLDQLIQVDGPLLFLLFKLLGIPVPY